MVEAGGPESVAKSLRDRLVVTQHDPDQDRAPITGRPADERPLHERRDAIRQSAEPAAPPDLAPAIGAQHDVDPLATKPRPLVEAVFGTMRLFDHRD
jgi:hypothetical protein